MPDRDYPLEDRVLPVEALEALFEHIDGPTLPLPEAAHIAAERFREYERMHRAKGKHEKAESNACMARMLERAISAPGPDALAMLADLRAQGWMVAVHNDYRQRGGSHTFWLLTRRNEECVKGEGRTDAEALWAILCELQARKVYGAGGPAAEEDRCLGCGRSEEERGVPNTTLFAHLVAGFCVDCRDRGLHRRNLPAP